jgi:hypothetical protein
MIFGGVGSAHVTKNHYLCTTTQNIFGVYGKLQGKTIYQLAELSLN